MSGPYSHLDYEVNKPILTDSTGRRLTVGLFEETADSSSSIKPVFKLSDWRRVYVDIADPTEYEAAMVLIGSWDHWQLLLESKHIAAHVELWRREVEVKLRSRAIVELVQQSKSKMGTAAAKWLAEAGFAPRDKRNKKAKEEDEDVSREAQQRARIDAKRLGLVQGGKQ